MTIDVRRTEASALASASLTVGTAPAPPDIAITSLVGQDRGAGVFDFVATLTNNGPVGKPASPQQEQLAGGR